MQHLGLTEEIKTRKNIDRSVRYLNREFRDRIQNPRNTVAVHMCVYSRVYVKFEETENVMRARLRRRRVMKLPLHPLLWGRSFVWRNARCQVFTGLSALGAVQGTGSECGRFLVLVWKIKLY